MSSANQHDRRDPLTLAAEQIRSAAPVEPERASPAASPSSGLWMPPVFLGAVILAAVLLLRKPDGLWGYVVGGIFVVVFGWFLVSTLWPGRVNRACPECSSESLVRLDENSHHGLRCTNCGHTDESASSFTFAEEEGTLEDTVLRERGRVPSVPGGPK